MPLPPAPRRLGAPSVFMSSLSLRPLGFAGAGVAQALSVATPWNGQPLWWLQLISLAALVWQLDALRSAGAGWRAGALHGWLFATAWLGTTFWWLFISMHTYGGLPAPLAALAVLALAAGLALYYAVACACFMAFAPVSWAGRALFFVALWTLAELVRGSWFTGFPWGAGGYAHVDGPLSMFARWLGVYGVGAVAVLAAMAIAQCLRLDYRRHQAAWLAPVGAALCLAAAAAGSHCAVNLCGRAPAPDALSAGRLQVALLQGNIPQDEKFVPGGGIATALGWYGEQLQGATASLVVTPETALPLLPAQLPPGYLEAIA
ncbi:MAG: apolipoprotein N-acyltransferase, partial [Variovorax sp.]|nr:apolipoprotein N-acyltransferase [Variovorax sp.]